MKIAWGLIGEALGVLAAGVALGLALVWIQDALGIPKPYMQIAMLVVVGAAMVAAIWLGVTYARELAKEDDWD